MSLVNKFPKDKPVFKNNVSIEHKYKQLTFLVDRGIHSLIKAEAAEEGMTIKEKMLSLICVWLREKGRITITPETFRGIF